MEPRLTRKKGAILLQTMVMSILLCMMAVMLMKWVLARYIITGRVYRSSVANVRTQGYVFQSFPPANWQTTGVVGVGNTNVDTKTVYRTVSGPALPQTITGTVDEDQ